MTEFYPSFSFNFLKVLKLACLALILKVSISTVSAQNLVPNPSFEDTLFCPWAESQMPENWLLFGNSADYYHSCSSSNNVPNTPTGFHPANSGEAMLGLFTYVSPSNPAWPDYREYVGVQLNNSLTIGQKYYISFFLNFGSFLPGWQQFGADGLGMKFSTVPYSENNPPALNNSAHLFVDSVYTDATQWIKVSGAFIADSSYNYLVIGNFFDEIQTDTVSLPGPFFGGSGSYYFVDDVCVSPDSLFNESWTEIGEVILESSFHVFPNPTSSLVTITNELQEVFNIDVFNSIGKLVYHKVDVNFNYVELDVSNYSEGFLLIRITSQSNQHLFQILKQ